MLTKINKKYIPLAIIMLLVIIVVFGQTSGKFFSSKSAFGYGGGGGSSGSPLYPHTPPPEGFSVVINNNDAETNSRMVNLTLNGGPNSERMAISNLSDFRGASQETYQSTKTWDLCSRAGGAITLPTCPNGSYTVYVKFYNQYGQASDVVSDPISLGVTPPSAEAPPPSLEEKEEVESLEGKFIKDASSPAIYLVENGKKRPIISAKAFESYNYKWEDIEVIEDVSILPSGEMLRGQAGVRNLIKSSGNQVYFLAPGNIKRWITSEEIFIGLSYKWSDIITVNDDVLDSYKTGDDITESIAHPDGSLIKYPDNPKVYLIENGAKRWIINEKTFNEQGYDWGDIIEVPVSEIYSDGANMGGTVLGAKTSKTFVSLLKLGSRGDEVKLLQAKLKELGYYPQDTDTTGYFGPITEQAVKDFQAARGLEVVGSVGPKTRAVLNSYY